MSDDGHRALVVEHDDQCREIIGEVLAALGHHVRFAATVDDALAAIREEDFCYVSIEPDLPARAGSSPLEGGGERVMAAFRALDARRDASDFHRTPLIVTTGVRDDGELVSRMYDRGASAFMAKPLRGRISLFRDKVLTCLSRGGRADHGACARYGLVAQRARAVLAAVRVMIDGATLGRRTEIVINDVRRTLQDAKFAVFVRLVSFHVRSAGIWCSREAIGVVRSREALSRIRVAFRGLVPKGFEVIQGDGSRRFRLNQEIAVERVDWAALATHANANVRKVAREELERAGKK